MRKDRIRRNRVLDSKGVTLVELVVAMALFVIVIVPICASFITSMRVNQKSRKMMAANDIAQSIVDGFSGKTYEGVKKSISVIGDGDLSGNLALSTVSFNGDVSDSVAVSANLYNLQTTGKKTTWADMGQASLTLASVSENEMTIFENGTNITLSQNVLLISENKAQALTLNMAAARDFKSVLGSASENYAVPCLMGVTNTDENVSFLCYTGLHSEGYYFDAVVQFIPMANKKGQKYYSYEAMIYIYEVDKTDLSTRLNKEPVLSLMTGIKNRNG